MKPIPETSANSAMKMPSSSHLTSMSALPPGRRAVDEDGQNRADRNPGHLVPPEERDAEQLGAVGVVDPREQHAEERHEQQPVQPAAGLTFRRARLRAREA